MLASNKKNVVLVFEIPLIVSQKWVIDTQNLYGKLYIDQKGVACIIFIRFLKVT